jgi:hypothetical protein
MLGACFTATRPSAQKEAGGHRNRSFQRCRQQLAAARTRRLRPPLCQPIEPFSQPKPVASAGPAKVHCESSARQGRLQACGACAGGRAPRQLSFRVGRQPSNPWPTPPERRPQALQDGHPPQSTRPLLDLPPASEKEAVTSSAMDPEGPVPPRQFPNLDGEHGWHVVWKSGLVPDPSPWASHSWHAVPLVCVSLPSSVAGGDPCAGARHR